MFSPMTEKAAKAAWMRHHVYGGYNAETREHMWMMAREGHIRTLLSFLNGLREPDEAAQAAVWSALHEDPNISRTDSATAAWTATIDHLLRRGAA